MKKQYFLIPLLALLALLLIGYSLFKISKSRTFQVFGEIIPRVETDKKVVALTFDDAPTDYSDEVLEILAEKNTKATFYMVGKNIEKQPQEAKNIEEAGHELGNHSYSHQRFLLKSMSFVKSEIETTNKLIRDAGYEGEITFRPPYGKKLFILPWYLKQHNIKTIMVDVEPDTYFQDTEGMVKYTLENTQPGSIILLHPFCEACGSARQATGEIIDGLREQGYEFVTVSELLEYK